MENNNRNGHKAEEWHKKHLWKATRDIRSQIEDNFKDAGFLWWKAVPRTLKTIADRISKRLEDVFDDAVNAWRDRIKKVVEDVAENILTTFGVLEKPKPVAVPIKKKAPKEKGDMD